MPDFHFSQALTANQLDFRPLANWKYRRLPFAALVTVLVRATGISARLTAAAGAQEVLQKSPIQTGGVAGTIPVPQTTPVLQFVANPFDEIVLSIDEVSGLTPTVDGYINVEPA
jgi:hypothetical protein